MSLEKDTIITLENKEKYVIENITYYGGIKYALAKSEDEKSEIIFEEVLENNDKNIEDEVDLKFKIKKLYEKMKEVLKDREKLILELRFGLNGEKPKTQNEIADSMAISRSYVSRIETKAINKLAKEFRE